MPDVSLANMLLFPLFYMGLDWASGPFLTTTGVSLWVLSPGLSVALLARYGLKFAPLVFLSALLSLLFVWNLEISLLALAAIALVIMGGYTAVAALIRSRIGVQVALWGPREVNRFALYSLALSLLVAGAGVGIYVGAGLLGPERYFSSVLHWWVGDAIGVLVLTPVLMLAITPPRPFEWLWGEGRGSRPAPPSPGRIAEIAAQAAAICAVVWITVRSPLGREFHLYYLAFLPLIWVALRHGLPGSAIGGLGLSVAHTIFGAGYLPLGRFTELQLIVMTLSLTGLVMGAAISQRERARQRLIEARENLEIRVSSRTRQLSREVEERKKAQAELAELARTDPLTGVLNRRHLGSVLSDELERFRRYRRPFTVLFLDIDHFKALNDRHGHRAGDEVLKSFSRTCASELRLEDRFGRLGGEEFCAILPETRAFTAIGLANRLRQRVASTPVEISGQQLYYTVSIGVAEVEAGDSIETVLGRADETMYRAKRAGRNQVAFRAANGDRGVSAGPP